MSEKPILFSGPMVRANLDGKKTQTRRVVKPQPATFIASDTKSRSPLAFWVDNGRWVKPPYQPGMTLWVRETWQVWSEFDKIPISRLPQEALENINYPADGNIWDARKRPSIYMARAASRITLEVTDVRVEQLQDISEDDVLAEGVDIDLMKLSKLKYRYSIYPWKDAFAHLWDSLNAARGFGWDLNPWVWVIEFRRAS